MSQKKKDAQTLENELKKGYKEMAQINLELAQTCFDADNDCLDQCEQKLTECE